MGLVKMMKLVKLVILAGVFVFVTGNAALAEVKLDGPAIEAKIAAAVANGEDPELSAKNAVADAVRAVVASNPDYPGGEEALQAAIFDAIAGLQITGLDDTDLLISTNHALGISVNPELRAYEAPGTQNAGPAVRERVKAKNKGGNTYGLGGKPKPGSPT